MKSAFLFPGQGAQYVGMGGALAASLPAAKVLFDQASAALGYDLLAVCTNGPAERLNATNVSQPAIFVASLAALESLKQTDPAALDGVIATARACVTGCTAAPDRLTCLQGCGADAEAGAGACAEGFGTCRVDCGVSTPTTTLPPPAACGPDSTGTCGGTCPVGLTCQAPPPGSAIALACICRP